MGNQRAKILTVAILLIAAGGYSYWKYKSLQPTAAINNGVTGDFQRPTETQRKDFMEQAAAYAELSPEQVQKLEEIRKQAGDNRFAMITSGAQVLTQEQRQKMREYFMNRMDSKAKKAMSDGDFEAFKAKREQMIQRWRNGGGPGGRGPGGRRGGPNAPNGGSNGTASPDAAKPAV